MCEQKRTIRDNLYRHQMLTSIVANIFNYAVGRGLDVEKISAATGLQRTDLLQPETRLPEIHTATIWQLLGEAFPGESLALHAASAAPLTSFGQLALAVQYAEDARSALQTLIQYQSVLSEQLELELIEVGAEAILKVQHPFDELDGGYGAEAGLAMLNRLGHETMGGESPLLRVCFKHHPFAASQVYENFFGVPVYFQQPYNALVIHRDALDVPTLKRDVHLFRYLQENLELLQDHWRLYSNTSLINQLQAAIAHNAEFAEYSAEALAQQMNMSLRSLQRLASEHGVTIRQLLDTTREAKAKELLSNLNLSVAAIATRLGYSDERAFRRAFKRWTDQTPAEFRRTHVS